MVIRRFFRRKHADSQQIKSLSSYTKSILGDTCLLIGVPRAPSELAEPLPMSNIFIRIGFAKEGASTLNSFWWRGVAQVLERSAGVILAMRLDVVVRAAPTSG